MQQIFVESNLLDMFVEELKIAKPVEGSWVEGAHLPKVENYN